MPVKAQQSSVSTIRFGWTWLLGRTRQCRLGIMHSVLQVTRPVVFTLGVATLRGVANHLWGSRVDILCTQLYYNCFIRILDGGRWFILGMYDGLRCKEGRKPLTSNIEMSYERCASQEGSELSTKKGFFNADQTAFKVYAHSCFGPFPFFYFFATGWERKVHVGVDLISGKLLSRSTNNILLHFLPKATDVQIAGWQTFA